MANLAVGDTGDYFGRVRSAGADRPVAGLISQDMDWPGDCQECGPLNESSPWTADRR